MQSGIKIRDKFIKLLENRYGKLCRSRSKNARNETKTTEPNYTNNIDHKVMRRSLCGNRGRLVANIDGIRNDIANNWGTLVLGLVLSGLILLHGLLLSGLSSSLFELGCSRGLCLLSNRSRSGDLLGLGLARTSTLADLADEARDVAGLGSSLLLLVLRVRLHVLGLGRLLEGKEAGLALLLGGGGSLSGLFTSSR